MPRESGACSNPKTRISIMTYCGLLDRPLFAGDDAIERIKLRKRNTRLAPQNANPFVQLIKKRNAALSENSVGPRPIAGEHPVSRVGSRHAGDRILLFIQVVFAPRQYLCVKHIQNEKLIG